jgi:hypothetical protein
MVSSPMSVGTATKVERLCKIACGKAQASLNQEPAAAAYHEVLDLIKLGCPLQSGDIFLVIDDELEDGDLLDDFTTAATPIETTAGNNDVDLDEEMVNYEPSSLNETDQVD